MASLEEAFEQFRVEDTDDTITHTHITTDERKQYKAVIVKCAGLLQVRPNVIFEWVKFNRRVQKEGELVEQFITSLYNLVDTCDFGDLKNKMIRDRIVVGIWDQALSKCLQTVADLTLEKAHNPCPAKRSGTRASARPEWLIKGGQVTRLGAKAGFQLQGQESLSKEKPKCIQGPNN